MGVRKGWVEEEISIRILGVEQRKLTVQLGRVSVARRIHFLKSYFGSGKKDQPYSLLSKWKALCLNLQGVYRVNGEIIQEEGSVCLVIVSNVQFLNRYPIHSLIETRELCIGWLRVVLFHFHCKLYHFLWKIVNSLQNVQDFSAVLVHILNFKLVFSVFLNI